MSSLQERAKKYIFGQLIKRTFVGPVVEAHVRSARTAGHTVGHREGLASGQANGYAEGYGAGHEAGDTAGYARGYADGENVFRVVDERTPVQLKDLDTSLYGPKRFPVTKEMADLMRAQVKKAVAAELIGNPTDDQWKMILADHPATCVSAGAGSGKSTTLILRVVFMVEHLRIPLGDLTIISFTKASCGELRVKLAKVLGYWQGLRIDPANLNRVVSTYHSLLLRLIRPSFPGLSIFENGDKEKILSEEHDDQAQDPALPTKLNPEQTLLLYDAYAQLYRDDEEFRGHVLELFKREFDLRLSVPVNGTAGYSPYSWRHSSARELPIIQMMREIWKGWGLEQAGFELGPFKAFTHEGYPYYADARVGPDGPWVVLGLPKGTWPQQVKPPGYKDSMSLPSALKMRRIIFAAHCGAPVLLISRPKDLEQLKLLREVIADESASVTTIAPKFEVKLPGERRSMGFTEALFQQGSFIGSLGRDVPGLLASIPAWRASHTYEHHFTACLTRFWTALEKHLADRSISTYNRAFWLSTQDAATMRMNPQVLNGMRHLLVDEFQDISPLVADWLVAVQRRVLDQTFPQPVSIMSIGDDWQSIYAWRGSSPDLFIRFARYFPSHEDLGPADSVKLADNFRSVPEVVADADLLIQRVINQQDKHVRAKVVAKPDDHGLRLFEYRPLFTATKEPTAEQVAALLKPLILDQYREAAAWDHRSDDIVLVMTRDNAMRKAIKSVLPKWEGLSVKTYHRAKGLEADIAFMIGDCEQSASHPFRHAVYDASERFSGYTYEQAQEDEAYRLGYVGVTRGKRRTLWYVKRLAGSFAAAACASKLVVSTSR